MSLPYTELVAEGGLGRNHEMLIEEVPHGARVLDVGCAGGYLADALAGRGATTVGIEPHPESARAAETHCERVFNVTVEGARDLPELATERFDVVIFADVLEHLVDPRSALEWSRSMLAPGGRVAVSIPNVAHWSVRWSLARGRFEYEDYGLLDRTHLRFFTHKTARELAEDAGFRIVAERFTPTVLPGEATLIRVAAALRGQPSRPQQSPPSNGSAEPRAGGPGELAFRGDWPKPAWLSRETVARIAPGLFALQFVMTLEPRG
jgi:methionine biosynthesis protein MetW